MILTIVGLMSRALSYIALSYQRSWYRRLLQTQLSKASVIIRKAGGDSIAVSHGVSRLLDVGSVSQNAHIQQTHTDQRLCVSVLSPRLNLSVDKWTSYLNKQHYHAHDSAAEDKHYIVLEAVTDQIEDYLHRVANVPEEQRILIHECVTPIAWCPGTPFGILAECTLERLVDVIQAFRDDTLFMDDNLELTQLFSVHVDGEAACLLKSPPHSPLEAAVALSPTPGSSPLGVSPVTQNKFHPLLEPATNQSLVHCDSNESLAHRSSESSIPSNHTTPNHMLNLNHTGSNSNENLAQSADDLILNARADMPVNSMPPMDISPGIDGSVCRGVSLDDSICAPVDMLDQDAPLMCNITDSMAGEALATSSTGQNTPLTSTGQNTPINNTPVHTRKTGNRSGGSKPPNVLIYCGKKDRQSAYDAMKRLISRCIRTSRYVIYLLKHDDVLTKPWQDNTELLIIASDKVYDGVDEVFLKYFQDGGTLINFTSSLDEWFVTKSSVSEASTVVNMNYESWNDVCVISGRHEYSDVTSLMDDVVIDVRATNSQTRNAVVIQAEHLTTGGIAVLSQVHLDKGAMQMAISPEIFSALKQANPVRYDILRHLFCSVGVDTEPEPLPDFTPAYMIAHKQGDLDSFTAALRPRIKNGLLKGRTISFNFNPFEESNDLEITDTMLPICTQIKGQITLGSAKNFDQTTYWKHLHTEEYGRCVIYVDVINSTMNLFDSLMFSTPAGIGLVAIAAIQTSGKGRGGNAWLSPRGSAMFSTLLRVDLQTRVGQQIGYVQHIAAVAVIEAVRTIPGYEGIQLRVKWPNDIYYKSDMKLGGILVQSSVMGKMAYINVGCGVNVSNADPTICVNDLITQHNEQFGTNLPTMCTEELIARALSKMEELVADFQQHGDQKFLQKYYKYWLHSYKRVQLESESGVWATIRGLDEHGYLQVELDDPQAGDGGTTPTTETPSNIISVQSDGNSFDMMRNMIIPKNR